VTYIFHMTTRSDALMAAVAGEYRHPSLEAEGFIHCSYPDQIAATANKHYRGHRDMVLLQIARAEVPVDVVDENTSGGAALYPHIYGPLPMAAVTAIHEFPCNEDGTFDVPASVPRT
jgi:uncharacterized protein (DUF952 family)